MVDIASQAIESSAEYSDDGLHRYVLRRKFARGDRGMVNFMMLNPSTATEHFNDPTVHRCEKRALQWGYSELVVTNLFSFRATKPEDMMAAGESAKGGLANCAWIMEISARAESIICAWGKGGHHMGAQAAWLEYLRATHPEKLYALRLAKDGTPCHPLYLPYVCEAVPL